MGLWQRFWSKSRFERRIALESAVSLLATRIGLWCMGFRRWHNFLARQSPAVLSPMTVHEHLNTAQTIARMEMTAARHLPFHPNCLEQSLALWWVLRRHGVAADLRVGVRKDSRNFEAHAWVEASGAVLNPSGDEHRDFVPFDQPIQPWETQIP